MLRNAFFSLLGALALMSNASAADLRVATSADTYPYNFGAADGCRDPRGVCGFEVELFDAVCREAGLNCQWSIAPWGEVDVAGSILHTLVNPTNGRFSYDMVVASATSTEKRSAQMHFSSSYYTAWNIFVGKAELNVAIAPNGFPVDAATQPLRIGTWSGSLMDDLKKAYGGNARYLKLMEVADPIASLKKGDLDLIFTFTGTEMELVRFGAYNMKGRLIENDQGPNSTVGAAFRKNAEGDAWKTKINAGLISVRRKGIYQTISQKWMGRDIWDCKYGPKFQGDGCP